MGKYRIFRAIAISGAVILPAFCVGSEPRAKSHEPISLTLDSAETNIASETYPNSPTSAPNQTAGIVCGVYSKPQAQESGSTPSPIFQIARTPQGSWQMNALSNITSVDGDLEEYETDIKQMAEKGLPIMFPSEETLSAELTFANPIDPEKFMTVKIFVDSSGAINAIPLGSPVAGLFDISVLSEKGVGEISVVDLIDPNTIIDLKSIGSTGPESYTYNLSTGIQGLVPNGWSAGRDSLVGIVKGGTPQEIISRVIVGNNGCAAIVSSLDSPGLFLTMN